MVPNGDTPPEIASHPALAGLDLQPTGARTRPVLLATKTRLVERDVAVVDQVVEAADRLSPRMDAHELRALRDGDLELVPRIERRLLRPVRATREGADAESASEDAPTTNAAHETLPAPFRGLRIRMAR